MLQETALRVCGKANIARDVLIVCNDVHRFLVAEQLLEVEVPARIVLEPEGRNTAPAVALAAMLVLKDGEATAENSLLLIMPADHVINMGQTDSRLALGGNAAIDQPEGPLDATGRAGYRLDQVSCQGQGTVPGEATVK